MRRLTGSSKGFPAGRSLYVVDHLLVTCLNCVRAAIAQALVATNRPLVYGGGNTGIMGVVSGAVANCEGGKVTGIIPYAIYAAGGEDKGNGRPKSSAVVESLLDEKRRGDVRIFVTRLSDGSPCRTCSWKP